MIFVFYCFLAYLAYNLIFNFILPIYRTTRKVKRGFDAMKDQMNGQQPFSNKGEYTAGPGGRRNPNSRDIGEYIDFEDIK